MRRQGLLLVYILMILFLAMNVYGKLNTPMHLNSAYADIKSVALLTERGTCFEKEEGVFVKNGFLLDTNSKQIQNINGEPLIFANTTIKAIEHVTQIDIYGETGVTTVPYNAIQVVLEHKETFKTNTYTNMLIKVGD